LRGVERGLTGHDWTISEVPRQDQGAPKKTSAASAAFSSGPDGHRTSSQPAVTGRSTDKIIGPKVAKRHGLQKRKYYREQMIIPGIKSLKLVKAATSLSFLIYRTLDMFFAWRFQK